MVSVPIDEITSLIRWHGVFAYGHFEEFKQTGANLQLHRFAMDVKEVIAETILDNPNFVSDFSSKSAG
ncbi:hypothetical protein RQM65_15335 [Pricia sp. S334]|uniref:Uncharacterized protein n=1 Tax=Pricia mediterranea TaxID=3076079 RepID=A0ABU3L8M7_9FLAO|nr:hypothetical protein [Pricia sp. S334]MDT7830040.1 hypothetical protein [Pricia sp. S334]